MRIKFIQKNGKMTQIWPIDWLLVQQFSMYYNTESQVTIVFKKNLQAKKRINCEEEEKAGLLW